MKASPKNIWQVPVYLPYLQPALTDGIIADAEQKLGYKLPDSFIALLKEQNGGYIRFSLDDICHEQIYGIGPHFPSLLDVDWENDQEYVDFQLNGLIPFDGGGNWHLCLDYRKNSENPSVSYIDIECEEEREVAPFFDDYLKQLEMEIDEDNFVLPNINSVDQFVAELGAKLQLTFEEPDTWTHGYPIYRVQTIPDAYAGIWISPNEVPRGFVREEDFRYDKLKNNLPGTAQYYPELPENSILLTATDDIQLQVIEACKTLSIQIQPLSKYLT